MKLQPIRLTACLGAFVVASCTPGGSVSRADTDTNGEVSPAEFDSYMKKTIFETFDADGDGQVTMEEWRALSPKGKASEFTRTDTNGDGVITRAEADAAFDKEGSLNKLFKKVDTDGNGSLSQAEVNAFHAKFNAQAGTDWEKLEKAATSK